MENTQNLNLKQWQLEDFILMEDFNADNQKLDAAFAALQQSQQQTAEDMTQLQQGLALVKLGSAVGSGTDRLEMDLSGVDISQYGRLYLQISCQNVNAAIRLFFTDSFSSTGGGLSLGSAELGGYTCQLQLAPLGEGFWYEYAAGDSEGGSHGNGDYSTLVSPAAMEHLYLAGYNNGSWRSFDESCRMTLYGWRW